MIKSFFAEHDFIFLNIQVISIPRIFFVLFVRDPNKMLSFLHAKTNVQVNATWLYWLKKCFSSSVNIIQTLTNADPIHHFQFQFKQKTCDAIWCYTHIRSMEDGNLFLVEASTKWKNLYFSLRCFFVSVKIKCGSTPHSTNQIYNLQKCSCDTFKTSFKMRILCGRKCSQVFNSRGKNDSRNRWDRNFLFCMEI